MAQYKLCDISTDPERYMKTWDSGTGEVLTTDTDYSNGYFFSTATARNNAITLINSCPANVGKFIGHIPPPPKP